MSWGTITKCRRTCLDIPPFLLKPCWCCSRKRRIPSTSVAFQRRMRLYGSRSYCRLLEVRSPLSETPWSPKWVPNSSCLPMSQYLNTTFLDCRLNSGWQQATQHCWPCPQSHQKHFGFSHTPVVHSPCLFSECFEPSLITVFCLITWIFQRFHVVTYKKAVDTWDEVDATLVKWRKQAKSEKELAECAYIFLFLCSMILTPVFRTDPFTTCIVQTSTSTATPRPQSTMLLSPQMFQDGWRRWTPTRVKCRALLPTKSANKKRKHGHD